MTTRKKDHRFGLYVQLLFNLFFFFSFLSFVIFFFHELMRIRKGGGSVSRAHLDPIISGVGVGSLSQ